MFSELSFPPKFLALGLAGKGKSTVLNHIADGSDSGRFPTNYDFSSCTLQVSSHTVKIAGTTTPIEIYDLPGFLAADLSFEQWKSKLEGEKIGYFNGILWVVSALDRPSVEDIFLFKAMEGLIAGFSEKNIVLVMTHCDIYSTKNQAPINPAAMQEQWLAALNKNLKTKIQLSYSIAFGLDQTSTYQSNYRLELAKIVDNFGIPSMSIRKDINLGLFGQNILQAVDPRISENIKSLIEAKLQKKLHDHHHATDATPATTSDGLSKTWYIVGGVALMVFGRVVLENWNDSSYLPRTSRN
jgi:hypothetical protein